MTRKKFNGFAKDNTDTQFHFSEKFAIEFGVKEAIILNNLQFWIITNIANRKNFYEGRTWTYNSVRAWLDIFKFYSAKEIRGALQRLVERGVLRKGNFNKNQYDRTAWYAFENEFLFIDIERIKTRNMFENYELDPVTKGQMEDYERANRN